MKKITSILALSLACTLGFAQSQRMELYEEFSGENCGPCAATNPGLNTLLQAASNPTKIISIKYECPIPSSAGPNSLYGQNTADVGARQTYYSVPFAPYARFSGTVIPTTPPSNNGHAGLLTQNIIDTAYLVNSPFRVTLSHTFNATYDSVRVTMVITASQAYTSSGSLYARVALEEAAINLSAPTGSNGEKDFYYTMRKMIPSPTGTLLPSTWTNAQTQTVILNAKVPTYIYDKEQICFVGLVQSDGDKRVQQSAISNPVIMALDAGITAVTAPLLQCINTFTPTATIKNFGSSTLTTCTLNFQIDAAAPTTQAWTGSLASGATMVVTLPVQTSTPGTHTFSVWTSSPNGAPDYNPGNDKKTANFNIEGTAAVAPLMEGFTGATFPPAGWLIDNQSQTTATWTRVTTCGGFGNSAACARMNFYACPAGNINILYARNVNLSASATTAAVSFNVAYAQYSNENDQLDVEVSSNCGSTWTNVYSKSGSTLMTAPATTAQFVPTAAQWRNEIVSLNAFAGLTNVLIRFKATSAYGNHMYLDDVNISNTTSIQENNAFNSIDIYPNPFSDNTNIHFNLKQTENVNISVYNTMGQKVFASDNGKLAAGENTIVFNSTDLSNGIYMMTITAGNNTITRKVTINK